MKLPKWTPYAAVLLLLPAALLFFSAGKLHYPTAQWDGWALESVRAIRAGTFAADPYIIHPPLYLYLLAFFRPLLGADLPAGARLFNFGCYLVTGWLVFLLSRRLAGKEHGAAAGLAGALLYYLSPLAFQGIFLLDLGDTSLVPAVSALYFWALASGANEFAWEFGAAGIPFLELSDNCFAAARCPEELMRDENTAFFVFGLASNTVGQVKSLLALTPEKLGRPFTAVKKGDYWIYDFNSR